jgi:hypothetical protein
MSLSPRREWWGGGAKPRRPTDTSFPLFASLTNYQPITYSSLDSSFQQVELFEQAIGRLAGKGLVDAAPWITGFTVSCELTGSWGSGNDISFVEPQTVSWNFTRIAGGVAGLVEEYEDEELGWGRVVDFASSWNYFAPVVAFNDFIAPNLSGGFSGQRERLSFLRPATCFLPMWPSGVPSRPYIRKRTLNGVTTSETLQFEFSGAAGTDRELWPRFGYPKEYRGTAPTTFWRTPTSGWNDQKWRDFRGTYQRTAQVMGNFNTPQAEATLVVS